MTTGVRVWMYFVKNTLGSIAESTTSSVFTFISESDIRSLSSTLIYWGFSHGTSHSRWGAVAGVASTTLHRGTSTPYKLPNRPVVGLWEHY